MPLAYVLINVETGSEDDILNQLRELNIVEESYVSYGVYDLVTKIRADTLQILRETVTRKIRGIDGVQSTLTLIMIEE